MPRTEPEALPLIYQREEIGRLVISPKNPTTGQVTGSTIDWETMRPLRPKKVAVVAAPDGGYVNGEDEPAPVL